MIRKPGPSTQRARARKAKAAWRALCDLIWATRPHYCERCGPVKGLTRDQAQFAHIDHRGMGGNPAGDKQTPENIELLCYECHDQHHRGRTT